MVCDDIDQMILDNEKLVHFVINRNFPDFRNDEDVIQSGRIGLWKACSIFDRSKGMFSTIAVRCIFSEITKELRSREKTRKLGYMESLDEVIGIDDDSVGEVTLGQILPSTENGYEAVEYDISRVVDKLSEQDADIFRMYLCGFTTSEISRLFGYSRTWAANIIRSIQTAARREILPKG